MASLHYFNPGSEAAILNASPYYTPAANQVKMQRDLAFLPAWYADSPDDYVWIEDDLTGEFLSSVSPLARLPKAISSDNLLNLMQQPVGFEALPWGISPQSLKFFETLNGKYDWKLKIPQWKDEYIQLSNRKTAKKCLEFIIQSNSEIDKNIIPEFYSDISAVENTVQTSESPLLAKAPYSSSGRGLLWLPSGKLHQSEKQIISGILKKQLFVSIEKVLDKQVDFAMLFHSDSLGKVEFAGLSLFETNPKGGYEKNIIASQQAIQNNLSALIDISLLEKVKNTLILFLSQTFGSIYKGCIGVDMMIYRHCEVRSNPLYKLHPCVEINLRNTMGLLALRLHQHFLDEGSTGYFKIDFSNKSGELLQKHQEMSKPHPVLFANGRLQSGYLSLCPVREDSKYRASVYLRAESNCYLKFRKLPFYPLNYRGIFRFGAAKI